MHHFLKRKISIVGVIVVATASFLGTPGATGATGATGANETSSPKPSASNPYGAGAIDPAGPNDPILVVTGSSKSQKFTMKDLLALKSEKISLFEPFVKKRQQFSVIRLSYLFKTMGIKSWEKVVTRALNNYEYMNTASEFMAANGYLAIKRNGLDIPYDQGGPIRLVYPDSSKWSKSLDPWNWSLESIYVGK